MIAPKAARKHEDRPVVLHARVVTGTGGGPEKTILNSPRFLEPYGYDAPCAYMHPPDDPGFDQLCQHAAATGAELISIPDRGAWDTRVVARLLRICRQRRVAIWHGHDYKSNAIGLLLRCFRAMHLVTTVHGWIAQSRKAVLYNAIDRRCLRRYDKVICVSEDLHDVCLAAGVPSERCVLIENSIDVDRYARRHSPEQAKQHLGVAPGSFLIGAVGRLSTEKGFDRLIMAVDQMRSAGLDVSLIIAGDGPQRDRLQQLIDDLGQETCIRLLGYQADPAMVYEAIDVFALSSLREGLANVLLEAMAMSVPIVATRVAGTPRLIAHEHNGLLVTPGSIDELMLALTRLLHNSSLCHELAAAGRATVEADYRFDVRMGKIANIYDGLLRADCRTVHDGTGSDHDAFDREQPGPPAEGHAAESSEESRKSFGDQTPVVATMSGGPCAAGTAVQTAAAIATTSQPIRVEMADDLRAWRAYVTQTGARAFNHSPDWLPVLRHSLRHDTYLLQATQADGLVGILPLALVQSRLFGRFLVSLPYLNTGGVLAESDDAARALIDRAIRLADRLNVRYLELRHEHEFDHPQLVTAVTDKVHMRRPLPDSADELWSDLKSKVRSQIRKAQRNEGLSVHWGRHELLDEFYGVFCHNMRDLGTPPFGRRLFDSILSVFSEQAELCCVRLNGLAIAAGLLVHGSGVTHVPSASSLRKYNSTNANMLMYWHLLGRAIQRNQSTFDFGRSSLDSGTFRFKKQWQAEPEPAVWQHYVRDGDARDMRPDNGRFDLMIRLWRRLPVAATRLIGPSIVRGIP